MLIFFSAVHGRTDVVFRCYNDAVALRYELPATRDRPASVIITDETTSFRLEGEPMAFVQYLENYNTSHEHTDVREGKSWYLGGLSAGQSRELTLSLAFLGAGLHSATIWKDAPDAEQDPNKLTSETLNLATRDTLEIRLAVDGGFAALFAPVEK